MKRNIAVLAVSLLIIFFWVQGAIAATFDHSQFDKVLKDNVDEKGLIAYNSIAKESRFHEYFDVSGAKAKDFIYSLQLGIECERASELEVSYNPS